MLAVKLQPRPAKPSHKVEAHHVLQPPTPTNRLQHHPTQEDQSLDYADLPLPAAPRPSPPCLPSLEQASLRQIHIEQPICLLCDDEFIMTNRRIVRVPFGDIHHEDCIVSLLGRNEIQPYPSSDRTWIDTDLYFTAPPTESTIAINHKRGKSAGMMSRIKRGVRKVGALLKEMWRPSEAMDKEEQICGVYQNLECGEIA